MLIKSTLILLALSTLISRLRHLQEIIIHIWQKNLGLSQWVQIQKKHSLLETLQILWYYLLISAEKRKLLSPKLLQRLQDWVSVCILMMRSQHNIERKNVLVAVLQLCWNSPGLLQYIWEATFAYRFNLEIRSRCRVKIMSSSGFGWDGLSLCSKVSVTKLPLILWEQDYSTACKSCKQQLFHHLLWYSFQNFSFLQILALYDHLGCGTMPTAFRKHRLPTGAAWLE